MAGNGKLNNVRISADKGDLVIRIKADKATCNAAPLSSSGKTRLLASSGGFQPVALPGLPAGAMVSLNVTLPAR